MGVKIDFKMKYPNFAAKLKSSMPEIRLLAAAMLQANRGMLFAHEGAYNGHDRWKGLQLRAGQPLKARGTLSQSLSPRGVSFHSDRPGRNANGIIRISGNKVTIGTNLKYAWLMNWGTTKLPGGVLKATKAKALMIPLPAGKKATATAKELAKGAKKITSESGHEQKVIFRKSVKIPARRFDDLNAQDKSEIQTALGAKIAGILRR